jgi:hypothetical protein
MYYDYEESLNNTKGLQANIKKLEGRLEIADTKGKLNEDRIKAKEAETSFLHMKLHLSETITEAISGPNPVQKKVHEERQIALTIATSLRHQLSDAEQEINAKNERIAFLEAKLGEAKEKETTKDGKIIALIAQAKDFETRLKHKDNDLAQKVKSFKGQKKNSGDKAMTLNNELGKLKAENARLVELLRNRSATAEDEQPAKRARHE